MSNWSSFEWTSLAVAVIGVGVAIYFGFRGRSSLDPASATRREPPLAPPEIRTETSTKPTEVLQESGDRGVNIAGNNHAPINTGSQTIPKQ